MRLFVGDITISEVEQLAQDLYELDDPAKLVRSL
jgi:hypothetical protein